MPRTEPFDQFSDVYDKWFEEHRDIYQAELEAIRRVLPPPPASGLEVGVGSGKFAAPLDINTGVEPSQKMAYKAEKSGIKVYPGVAESLPFPEDSFDFILMVTTICFVDDILKSFREARRVLKNKGFIIIGFVDKNSELGKEYEAKNGKSRFYREATFFSVREVIGFLEEADFEILKINQTLIPGQSLEIIQEGFGRGAFVVIKGEKR